MKYDYRVLLGLVLGGVALVFVPIADAGESGAPKPVNYARPFEPPTRPAFLPLPPGAVEPAGWLRDWCLAARDGYTGHMDEYDDEFKRAWAPDHKMTGEGLIWYKGAWPYEGGGYLWTGDRRYLEAAVGWHDLLERVAMQPHGVPVSDEPTGIRTRLGVPSVSTESSDA